MPQVRIKRDPLWDVVITATLRNGQSLIAQGEVRAKDIMSLTEDGSDSLWDSLDTSRGLDVATVERLMEEDPTLIVGLNLMVKRSES